MYTTLQLIVLLVSISGLWLGAVWVVESASRISRRMGISEIVIGLTVVAFGTSAPEFAVTVTAAIKDQANISVGNIVGSNIFNLGFILGGVALFKAINASSKLVYRDGVILILVNVLFILLLKDNYLSGTEGIMLNILLIAYLVFLSLKRETLEEDLDRGRFHWYEIPRMIVGLGLIITGGYFLVESASGLARHIGLSEWVIGITVVAAGTSAPEFVTSLVAVIRGKYGISAGNLVGSNLFNMLGVLGLASWIHPMTVTNEAYISIYLLTVLSIIVVIFMRTHWRISRLEGFLLVLLNLIVYLITILI